MQFSYAVIAAILATAVTAASTSSAAKVTTTSSVKVSTTVKATSVPLGTAHSSGVVVVPTGGVAHATTAGPISPAYTGAAPKVVAGAGGLAAAAMVAVLAL